MNQKLQFSKMLFVLALLWGSISSVKAGEGPTPFDPCGDDGPGCVSGGAIGLQVFQKGAVDTVMTGYPFMMHAGGIDSAGRVDTTFDLSSISISKVEGPGGFEMGEVKVEGWATFDSMVIANEGIYLLEFYQSVQDSAGLIYYRDTAQIFAMGPDTSNHNGGEPVDPNNPGSEDPCDGDPGCAGGGTTMIGHSAMGQGNGLYVDTVGVGVMEKLIVAGMTNEGKIDTLHQNLITIEVVDQPAGASVKMDTNQMSIMRWAEFGLEFSHHGSYAIKIIDTVYTSISDTAFFFADSTDKGHHHGGDTTVHNPGGPGGDDPCGDPGDGGKRENLGLYGGSSLDLTFGQNGRLFAAISTPASLFYSDDTAKTWSRAFPNDSLEYNCGNSGWGGRAIRVISNQNGWIGVLTSQEAGTLTSSVISYDNGDTWQTALDNETVKSLGGNTGPGAVRAIDLTEDHMFASVGQSIAKIDHEGKRSLIVDYSTLGNNAVVSSIAAAKYADLIYMVADLSGDFNASNGTLYKYNGSSFDQIDVDTLSAVKKVFMHPLSSTGDTFYVSGPANGIPNEMICMTVNGGDDFTVISPEGGMGWSLSDVDYSPTWGVALMLPGQAVSYDDGATWQNFQLTNNGGAVHPDDSSLVVGTKGRGVAISTTGANGDYLVAENYGLEAVTIKQIARSPKKTVFYIATSAGLAYTTAYLDTTIKGIDKWSGANGAFPVVGAGDDAGVSSVAIDPTDSSHVIAGYSNGFIVTSSGHTGFSNIQPSDWGNDNPRVNDIAFASPKVVIGVTGGENSNNHAGQGHIWRSENGGASWSKVSPTGFTCGNTVAVGERNGDTVIYVGTGLSGSLADSGAIWKSTDMGLNWSKVSDGPTNTSGNFTALPVYDLAVSPGTIDTVYAGAGSNLDHAFAYSFDGGETWETTTVSGEGSFTSVMVNLDDPDTVYTAIRRDIYAYDITTHGYVRVFRGLPGELVPDLVSGSILAGTNTGFFKIQEVYEEVTSQEEIELIKETDHGTLIYPNPSSGNTNIEFEVSETGFVQVEVYDMMGRKIESLMNGEHAAGFYKTIFEGSKYGQGTYMVNINVNGNVISEMIIIMD